LRSKEQISDEYKRIERALLKKDIEPIEAQVQSLQVIAELMVDLRTCLTRIGLKGEAKDENNTNDIHKMREIT
jgi:hypothetical protein